MDRVLLKCIFDELCTSFSKKEINGSIKKNADQNKNEINYCITLQELFDNLEKNKNVCMDVYMKREVLQTIYYCKDISIMVEEEKKKIGGKNGSDGNEDYNSFPYDKYNNGYNVNIHKNGQDTIINTANKYNLYINNIYIYNKHNLFYYERIKECKEKIFILLYIISTKYNGSIQSSLSKHLNIDVKMIHYHLKVLIQYSLIKKINININGTETNTNNDSCAMSNSTNGAMIKLSPSYILYYNIYFIYNMLPIFVKNILFSQNVLSINKIIMYLINKFIIIPQKILSLIFFKLLIVYNPYYFMRIRKALKIFNSILSNLINSNKIIMCKIKIQSNYEICYLNYKNKEKISYDRIINFLLSFYYNYDNVINFIDKSCYLMCEDYVNNEIPIKSSFMNNYFIHKKQKQNLTQQLSMYMDPTGQGHINTEMLQNEIEYNNHRSNELTNSNKSELNKQVNISINEFKSHVHLNMDDKFIDSDLYSSSQNDNSACSLSDFSPVLGNNEIEATLEKKTNFNVKYTHERNSQISYSESPTHSSIDSDNGSDNVSHRGNSLTIRSSNLSLYDEMKYIIISKGISGITAKEISQSILLSIKKTNTFLNKLVKNKEVVKIPERKDKSFMYRFVDNNIYQYIQNKKKYYTNAEKETEAIVSYDNKSKNINECNVNMKKKNLQNNEESLIPIQANSNQQYSNEIMAEYSPKIKTEQPNNSITNQNIFHYIKINNLNESLNILNYTNTINNIDKNVLEYVIPKYDDSINNFSNYKDFFNNYVNKIKQFEYKYDLFTCSFHLFYYVKNILQKKQTNKKNNDNTNLYTHTDNNIRAEENVCQFNESNISEHSEEFNININNLDVSKTSIDFIKHFMEDTTKLKSNLFIKRLFIFTHFLLCSKVTTFRFVQDLFTILENNGKLIDRKSVERLFNYSTKINAFFKKCMLQNSKNVKYYFYDSNTLTEKQSIELHSKIQQEYAHYFYKQSASIKHNDKLHINCSINLQNRTNYTNLDSKNKDISNSANPNCEIIADNAPISQISPSSPPNNYNTSLKLGENDYFQNIDASNAYNVSPKIYDTNALLNSCSITNISLNDKNNNNKRSINNTENDNPSIIFDHNKNHLHIDSLFTSDNASVDTTNFYTKKRKTEQDQQINTKNTPDSSRNKNNVLYIDVFNESAFACSENKFITPENKKKHTFKNFKMLQHSSNINYFYGYIFSKMERYKYFHKCLIRIMKRKVKQKRNNRVLKQYNSNLIFSKTQHEHDGVATCQNKMKKRKISFTLENIKGKNKKKRNKQSNVNSLKIKDILKNMYLDEYLKIISVRCKLNYIENYLLKKKKKKIKLKELPPMLFEYLTSYSQLHSNKNNLIKNFILNKSQNMYIHENKPLRNYYDHESIQIEDKKTNQISSYSNQCEENELKKKKDTTFSPLTQIDQLCQHDIDVIKNNDKISIFIFLYRKLKFLYNMKSIDLRFGNDQENVNSTIVNIDDDNIAHTLTCNTKKPLFNNSRNTDLNISIIDLKKNNFNIYIKKYATINLFSSIKPKKKKQKKIYNMMRYNHFEEYYYSIYLLIEQFKKHILENILGESSRKKARLSDIPKFLKIKNKNLKFLLSHNSYTNQLLLTRKIRKLFINLIKKVKRKETRKKANIKKHKLMEELIIYKEYNILYNIYNISKTNIEKYFFIFYDLYNNISTKNNYDFSNILEKEDNNNNTTLSYSCPFCKDVYFFKSDLLTHISNVHNTNKKFSDIISLMSNTKHTMHKTLSDILKIKNIINNASPAYGQTMRVYRDNNISTIDEKVDQTSLSCSNNYITKGSELLFHNNTSSDKFSQSTKETKKYEQFLQHEHNIAPDVLQVQNTEIKKNTELKKQTNKQISIIDQLNTNKIFSRNTHSSVKIKYSLRTVYLYFVTIFIQLYISRINLEKCTSHKKNIGDNKGGNKQKALSHQKLHKNNKNMLPKRKRNNLNPLSNKIKLISNKLNTFRLIYYLKNKTNSIPYKKSVWNKANKVMIGKFMYAVCKYIQNKLFYYFKKNIVNYFFILLNENLTRCILNYFPTYIYNCTYTNINYHFDKCIKNIYDFNFISLINLMKLFIINYGSNFILYKEIIKPLFYQKLRNIQNGIKYLKKNMYVVDTSYVMSNYIANDIVCDNIYSNLIYKSIFYKKKLSLFTKKKAFDNVIDIIYSFGSCYFSKILEYAHSENYQNKPPTLNCQIDQLLLHIDNVYNQEQNINYIPSNHENCVSSIFHFDDHLASTNLNKISNYMQIDNSYEEEISHINTTNNKKSTYKYNGDNFSNDHQMNAFNIFSDENFDANESTCNESKKYYFNKKLTIFDLNFYVHKFLKGDITLYACNKYTISDDIHSDEKKNITTKFNSQNKYYTPDIDDKQNEDVNNTKYSREFLKNNNKDKNQFEVDENSLSFNSSNDGNLDTFDQLSDDYEIIKLLENDNYNNEKLLGGINKHIKHLTKHVSEYFPNYYILNDLKKKILKRLSNIFSDNNNSFISYNFQNEICHNFYYDPNYINNNFFNYFKKYCIYIYQNYNNPTRSKKWKDFKNYTLLNTSSTNNFNFSDLFNKFIEKNNFPNSTVYNKNKLLIYNISKKTFIDFDIYPQNIHLYNIAYISNIQKNIESFLDIQVLNLKNGIFWLQSEKSTSKKKFTNLCKQVINNNSINANKLGINKEDAFQKHNSNISNKPEKKIKDSQVLNSNRRKYVAKYNSFIRETQIKKFIKKVTIRNINNSTVNNNIDHTGNNTSGISNDNAHKESFIFVVKLMYHVFCMDNIQNNYDEHGNYKAHIHEKNQNIKNVGHKINNMYKYKTTNNATIENINKNNYIGNNVYQTDDSPYESNIANNHDISYISDNANDPNNDTKEKEDYLFNQIMRKMLYMFFIVKQKKKKGCFIDSLKKKYIKKFINKACYNEYFNVKKEYNFILFLLNKLNLIKIFPFINTHKIFLAKYYNGINMCKRKTLFYEHNFKHPFLNMINYYLKNFKVKTQRYSDDEKKTFKKFIKKNRILSQMNIQHPSNNTPHEIGTAKNISNTSNVTNISYENSSKNITNESALANRYAYKNVTQEKIIYKKKYINYSDYVYINFINNNTLKKPNFIPRLILLFNLQCHIIIHDYFFMYLCENYEQIQKFEKSINDNCNDYTNILYNTRIGNKILNYMGNKKYPTVIKYIKRIINNACKYFEYNILLYINNNKGDDLQKHNNNNKSNTIYYFKDNYVITNSFIYLNGSINIKFMFFYILKIFFYIKNNPYSSIFDICKTIEILNLCDLNTLLRAMCDDGFISFKLMFVNKRSEIYKLKKNYQIINDFNNIMRNENIKKKKKTQIKKKRKAKACYFFDTTSEDEFSTDNDTFKTINKSKKDNTIHANQLITENPQTFDKIPKKNNLKNYNLFIDKILYKKVKLYYIQDENIIFKKYEGTLWN